MYARGIIYISFFPYTSSISNEKWVIVNILSNSSNSGTEYYGSWKNKFKPNIIFKTSNPLIHKIISISFSSSIQFT